MRTRMILSAFFAITTAVLVTTPANAVTITGGTGPGGIETTSMAGSNLQLWLDANSITGLSSGDSVSTWENRSTFAGSATDATQGDPDKLPLWIDNAVNGQAVVRFDGLPNADGDRLAVSQLGLQTVASGYVVALNGVQSNSGGSCCRTIFSEDTNGTNIGNNGYSMFVRGSQVANNILSISKGSGGAAPQVDLPLPVDNQMHVFGFRSDASTTDLFNNGGAPASANIPNTPTGTNYHIGGNDPNDARHYAGDIAEVALYDRSLNSAERTVIDNYFSAKYDIAIANDRYEGDTLGNGNYDLDVFGIGSLNTGPDPGSLTSAGSAGFGIEEANGTLDNAEFVLAGHKVETNSLVGTGEFIHWEREWYVDKTGDVDVTLAFDFSDAGLTGTPEGFSLLYRPDELSTFSTLVANGVISGDQVTFFVPNALLQDGLYTLGALVPEPGSFAMLSLGGMGLLVRRRRNRTRPMQTVEARS